MPWLMRPMAFIDFLLTRRRWVPPPLEGPAARVSALLSRASRSL